MRAHLGLASLLILLPVGIGCGGGDEGILVVVTQDSTSVPEPVDELEFVVGLGNGSGPYVRDPSAGAVPMDGRDLRSDSYRMLLHDGGAGPDPSLVIVAVIGRKGGTATAFGGWSDPLAFMPGKVIERDVVLTAATEGVEFFVTETGCLAYGAVRVAAAGDRDCDGETSATDCDDLDPTRSHDHVEVCMNGIDDDCDDLTVDDCVGECTHESDCDILYGPAPCGYWKCDVGFCDVVCAGCTDGDLDGYGTSDTNACAGFDCDDANDTVHDQSVRACYTADPGTIGVGACSEGTEVCVGGVWSGLCTGEIIPGGEACNDADDDCNGLVDDGFPRFQCGVGACATSVDACAGGILQDCSPSIPVAVLDFTCDGIDDDCDGAIDEECLAGCVTVSTNGSDPSALLDNNATAFRNIQTAIDWAAGDATRPRNVCVAAGAICGSTTPGSFAGAVVMRDGVNLYGGYEYTTFTRCGGVHTIIATGTAEGVSFPSSVITPTVIDGFRIDRAATTSTAGITVDGGHAIISNVRITNLPAVQQSRGVHVKSGGDAFIFRSAIDGGDGSVVSIGVHSQSAHVTLRENCADVNLSGRCDAYCGSATFGTPSGIIGSSSSGLGQAYGVFLEESPGSTIEQSAVCDADADVGAAVRVKGNAEGTVIRASLINGWGGFVQSHGAWLEDCGGAAPWIVDNHQIASVGDTATTEVDAVRAAGDCHPVIDSNLLIAGGGEGGASATTGVHCMASVAGPSRCEVIGNLAIQGSTFGYPPEATGVRCDSASCARIEDNAILGNRGTRVWGVYIVHAGAMVARNAIIGGCAAVSATGVHVENAWTRFENNIISAGGLCNFTDGTEYVGVHTLYQLGPGTAFSESDFHSNDIDAVGDPVLCSSTGLLIDGVALAGVYQNNIFRGGDCSANVAVAEATPGADPRVMSHNNFDPYGAPVLYFDEDTGQSLLTPGEINALTDVDSHDNISGDSQYVDFPFDYHILPTSACIGWGTTTGAPSDDMDGDPRGSPPDIGADEL